MRLAVIAVFLCLVLGCNLIGPYDGSVLQLDRSVFMVNVDTWTKGRGHDWPDGSNQLRHDAEIAVLKALNERGYAVESCALVEFTPYEGAHISITFVAGDKAGVARWAALPADRFNDALRKTGPRPLVFKFKGDFRRAERMGLDPKQVNPTSQPK